MTTEEFREQVLKAFSDGSKPVMSKREMFAAMAMQGILSSGQPVNGMTTYHPDDIAFTATRYADELLKQLES